MCDICGTYHEHEPILAFNEQYKYDPTRTTALRNMFSSKIRARFEETRVEIKKAIVEQDVLALQPVNNLTANQPGYRQFDFPTDSRKVEEFMKWIEKLIEQNILTTTTIPQLGGAISQRWTDVFILDSYKRGVIRARQEMRKVNSSIPSIEQTGGIEVSMSTPFHADRVGLLYIRTYEDLKGITSQMSTQISRVLSQGMIDGDNPRLIARKLNYVISGMGESLGTTDTLGRFIPAKRRAEMLARTEIIRAHHKAMVQEYRNWGISGVRVLAEFRTAGDRRVCDRCQSMEGNIYTLDQAENLIPVHPLCRCIILPFENSFIREAQLRGVNI